MPIQISCPSCTRQLRVPDNLMGQKVKCPTCSITFTAEEHPSAPPAPEPEPPPPPREPEQRQRYSPVDEPPPRRRDYDDYDYDDRYVRRRSRYRDYRDRGYEMPHRGALILTLGILSIALIVFFWPGAPLFGLGLGLPSWIMGQADLKKMRAGIMDPDGEGNTRAGWVCGIIGTCMGMLGFLGCALFILMMFASAAAH